MRRNLPILMVTLLLVFAPFTALNVFADSEVGQEYSSNYSNVYGLEGTHFLFFNGTGIELIDVRNNTVLDSESCSSSPRISANRQYVMCTNAVYEHNGTQLDVVRLGNIDMDSRPSDNATVVVTGTNPSQSSSPSNCFGSNSWGTLQVVSGGNTIATIQVQYTNSHGTYASASIEKAVLMEDKPEIYVIFRKNGNNYHCAPGTQIYSVKLNYTTVSSYVIMGGFGGITEMSHGHSNICGEMSFSAIQYGAFFTEYGGPTLSSCHRTNSIATGAWIQYDSGDDYTTAFTSPKCATTAWDSGSVTGHFITLNSVDVQIPKAPNRIACNSAYNATILTSNSWFNVWYDEDGDGDNDLQDQFPQDSSQWDDLDGDGYGDNPMGYLADDCVTNPGNSSLIILGCPDSDGDYYADMDDAFPSEVTQWNDTDYDGYGDNLNGIRGDNCPISYGTSTRNNTLGCLDSDFDGWADSQDIFVNDSSQWEDTDGDGYGDQLIGFQGDACPSTLGNSTEDRYGCPDADGDGWSDDGDDIPSNPTQWKDRDGDGYGDNATGTMADAFPSDGTQWNDTDGDGYGDEETGNRGDAFPNDPEEWQDSDSDGIGNNADDFPFDPSQQTDSDGDGFGDNPLGSGADKFPDDPSQWSDIDGDGYGDNQTGNNSDAFIADPTQHADRDGDGYGDSLSGRLADMFPDNPTQWIDQDGDGLGDNLSGIDADPYLFDFDNDGYNDSIDILPKLASPGDHDNDGCMDEVDAFPLDYRECSDFDGDGEGDNADTDDDNDGWTDVDEIREDTDPFDASDYPIEAFQLMIPGTTIGLDGWDLIGIFGGVPLFAWILFGFVTRNKRCRKYEDMLKGASTKKELDDIALKSEYSLMIRLLGPHQGIRLERLRAELDDALAGETHHVPEILEPEDITEDQTHIVEDEMVAGTVATGPSKDASGQIGSDGYEWTEYEGTNYFRTPNSGADWQTWKD